MRDISPRVNRDVNPSISVIIPVYNGAAFICETLDSILKQEGSPPDEVIVVDDGSTDQTPSILEKYKSRIVLKRIRNSGVANARNTGLRMASGEYILFSDHDDVWFKNKLERQVDAVATHPEVGFCCCNFVTHLSAAEAPVNHFSRLRILKQLNFDSPLVKDPFQLLIQGNFVGTTSSVLVRRNVVQRVGFFDDRYDLSDDYDYWMRCAKVTRFLLLSEPLLHKRLHESNFSHDQIRLYTASKLIFEDMTVKDKDYLRNNNLLGHLHRALARHSYILGNGYFEIGQKGRAFHLYWKGLTEFKTPCNFVAFLWKAFKKGVRLISCDTLSKKRFVRGNGFLPYRTADGSVKKES